MRACKCGVSSSRQQIRLVMHMHRKSRPHTRTHKYTHTHTHTHELERCLDCCRVPHAVRHCLCFLVCAHIHARSSSSSSTCSTCSRIPTHRTPTGTVRGWEGRGAVLVLIGLACLSFAVERRRRYLDLDRRRYLDDTSIGHARYTSCARPLVYLAQAGNGQHAVGCMRRGSNVGLADAGARWLAAGGAWLTAFDGCCTCACLECVVRGSRAVGEVGGQDGCKMGVAMSQR